MKKATHLFFVFLTVFAISFGSYEILSPSVGLDFDNFLVKKDLLRGNPSGEVVIVRIDNKSLDDLGRSDLKVLNLTKSQMAKALDAMYADGAKAVGIDIVFANRSDDASVLAEALQKYPKTYIAAKLGVRSDLERILPIEAFSGANWSMIDVVPEKSVVSRIVLGSEIGERRFDTLAVSLYRATYGGSKLPVQEGDQLVLNPIRSVPTHSDRTALIPFFRAANEFPYASFSDVVNGKFEKGFFAGKVVLVGEFGTLIHDSHFSPLDPGIMTPGVEFHANFLEGLITGKLSRNLSESSGIALMAVAAFVASVVFAFSGIAASIVYSALILIGGMIASRLAYSEGLSVSYFSIFLSGFLIPLPLAYVYRYFVVDRDRHLIETAFSHYIAPEVVNSIADDPKSLKLGGDKRKLTVFFSDIANFTTISETLGTERLFSVLSDYLSQMTDILIKHRGTLDKYIGDAVMGFFGAPAPMADQELAACRTAMEQTSRLRMLSNKWEKEGIPKISARIGIHTGEAMVGNIGSKNRFNYTAIGDTVNLASRLEGVNKEYGTLICVSESVATAAAGEFVFRELDKIRVKGKTEGVRIFELAGYRDDQFLNLKKLSAYEEALKTYYDGDFKKAKKAFEAISHDAPSVIMAERCASLLSGETKLENGIFVMHTK